MGGAFLAMGPVWRLALHHRERLGVPNYTHSIHCIESSAPTFQSEDTVGRRHMHLSRSIPSQMLKKLEDFTSCFVRELVFALRVLFLRA